MRRGHALIVQLWRENPSLSLAGFVISCFERLRPNLVLIPCRIAILRSFTVEPVIPLLRAAAFVSGIDLSVNVGSFNTYPQEILDQNSGLYKFKPDIVILAIQTCDVSPDLWSNFTNLSPGEITAAIGQVIDNFSSWVQMFRSHSQSHLILHSLEHPLKPNNGILDIQSETGQIGVIRHINRELLHLSVEYSGIYVLDYDALVSRHGRMFWYDDRKWMTMRMPIAANCLIHLANEWLRFLHPLIGKVCKVLVTDLDNTLWGGVIGEDGMTGIKLGPEYPGAIYQTLQRVILDLYNRGIILAVCSKNNLFDAMEVLNHHHGMLLRPKHFAALRINWNDKIENLREIATELNIGMDAIAFLDDNAVERQLIRSQLPEVTVIELPDDPIGYAQALRDSPVFERVALSAEDRDRGRHYTDYRLRTELKQSAISLEDFYRSLQIEVEISLMTQETLIRVSQLTQKTNQFNLTTRRYSEQQIIEMAANPNSRVYTLRMRDCFGDNGLVGVSITHYNGEICEIDTFLLSCRVINRTVETALLATISEQSSNEGIQRLVGWYLPTKKNAPAREFYSLHGFTCVMERDDESFWEFDLTCGQIVSPPWIKRQVLIKEKILNDRIYF